MSTVCKHCGSSDLDTDAARGDTVCTNCGSVLESQLIVSEVQFVENAGGGNSVIGQFVSAEGGKSHTLGGAFHCGYGKESRQITLQKGQRHIKHLGNQLHLNQHCIDTAFNFYKMAVARGMTRGRKTNHVIAACMYIVCRTEGTSHLLLDFADILDENVYVMGRTYLHIAEQLHINIPALDPCLYIQRFAHKLDFAAKTHDVAMTALRLVSRMKRDWMAQGRRPSGLCGAALLVAARIHNFNRTIKQIIQVVKIGEQTIKKRLLEFEKTASSQLTIDEFQKIDLEEEADPPSFSDSKKKAKLQQQLEEQLPDLAEEVQDLQDEIDKAIQEHVAKKHKRFARLMTTDEEVQETGSTKISAVDVDEDTTSAEQQIEDFLSGDCVKEMLHDSDIISLRQALSLQVPEALLLSAQDESSFGQGDTCRDPDVEQLETEELTTILQGGRTFTQNGALVRPSIASLGIRDTVEECLTSQRCSPTLMNEDDGELDLTGIDDAELEAECLYTEEEARRRAIDWLKLNADYLKEQKEKQLKRKREEEEEKNKPGHQAKRKRASRKKTSYQGAATAGEAIEKMLQEKKISNKINYEVLRDLNQPSSAAASSIMSTYKQKQLLAAQPAADVDPTPNNQASSAISFSRFRMSALASTTSTPPLRKAKVTPAAETAHKVKDEKPVKLEHQKKEEKKGMTAAAPPEVIVETGPVRMEDYGDEDEEDYEDEPEEEELFSAAQLLGHGGYGQYEEEEDYY